MEAGFPATDLTTRFIYDGWRAIEERVPASGQQLEQVRARYGFGLGLDEVLWMDRDVARVGGGDTPDLGTPDPVLGVPNGTIEARYFVHEDGLGSVAAVTGSERDQSGQIVVEERFTFSAYGKVAAWGAMWTSDGTSGNYASSPWPAQSRLGLPYLFTGQRLDPETGYYYYKNRFYDAVTGRFLRRDLIGYGDGSNLYAAIGDAPHQVTDPHGLARSGPLAEWSQWERDPRERSNLQQVLDIENSAKRRAGGGGRTHPMHPPDPPLRYWRELAGGGMIVVNEDGDDVTSSFVRPDGSPFPDPGGPSNRGRGGVEQRTFKQGSSANVNGNEITVWSKETTRNRNSGKDRGPSPVWPPSQQSWQRMGLWEAMNNIIKRDLAAIGVNEWTEQAIKQALEKMDKKLARRLLWSVYSLKGMAQSATEPELYRELNTAVQVEVIIQMQSTKRGQSEVYYGEIGAQDDQSLFAEFYFLTSGDDTWVWTYNKSDPSRATEAWVVLSPSVVNYRPPLGWAARGTKP